MNSTTEQLLAKVYEAQLDPRELAEAFEMSLGELAAWAGHDATMQSLRGLRLLGDMQTQLILSRYRVSAAAKLLELAQGEGELARKACVDLLKLELLPAGAMSGTGADTGPVDEQRLMAELARIGTDDADDNAD